MVQWWRILQTTTLVSVALAGSACATGSDPSPGTAGSAIEASTTTASPEEHRFDITVGHGGFEPKRIAVTPGAPVALRIQSGPDASMPPESLTLTIHAPLARGDVLELRVHPSREGDIVLTCDTSMTRGTIRVP